MYIYITWTDNGETKADSILKYKHTLTYCTGCVTTQISVRTMCKEVLIKCNVLLMYLLNWKSCVNTVVKRNVTMYLNIVTFLLLQVATWT